ncbi:MAG: polysaccharide deacetylase family protein [Spirochaetaceae bacterium]|jgi:peptidoglycan/xylan/chitin deacetylase (PgdA/CDA1 family)|nr:polysaccharide deacetylase family protein [Spirochaetaceae bacterium]
MNVLAILVLALCASCASGARVAEGASEARGETGPVESGIGAGAAEKRENIERLIAHNSERIRKRLHQDGGKYTVLGEIDGLTLEYDVQNAVQTEGGALSVPYAAWSEADGALRGSLLWTPPESDSGVVLSFDDDYFDVWERYFPLLESYQARATFFMQGGVNDFCTRAQAAGHEIAYHTKNHLDLRRVSEEVFVEETLEQRAQYTKAGIELGAFAFPFGFNEEWMHKKLFPSYARLRGFGVSLHLYHKNNNADALFVRSKSIDNIVYKDDDAFYRDIAFILRAVKFLSDDAIVFLTTHTISSTADWGIKPERLEFILKSAAELKLHFWRFKDLSGGAD